MEPIILAARTVPCRLVTPRELREDDGGLMQRHIDALDRAARLEAEAALLRAMGFKDTDASPPEGRA